MLPDEYEPLMLVVVLRSFSSQVDANGIPPAARRLPHREARLRLPSKCQEDRVIKTLKEMESWSLPLEKTYARWISGLLSFLIIGTILVSCVYQTSQLVYYFSPSI
jgi:hypothetical protein